MDVVSNSIGVLPLIKCLKLAYPDVTQPWYADNSGSLGTFDNLGLYFNSLKRNGPDWGYYPDTTKIILIVHPENLEVGGLFSAHFFFAVFTDTRYLGNYIGYEKSKGDCLKNRTGDWERNICAVAKTAGRYPHEVCTVVDYAIQSECIFLQGATQDT